MILRVKSARMKALVPVPSRSGTASNSGAAITVNSGACAASAAASGRTKSWRTNSDVPRVLADHANRHPVCRVRPAVQSCANRSRSLRYSITRSSSASKLLRRKRLVHLAPVHQLVRHRVVHGELVFGTAPGSRPGHGHQRAVGRQCAPSPRSSAVSTSCAAQRLACTSGPAASAFSDSTPRETCHGQDSFRPRKNRRM